jgi:hypothetical protein
MEKHHFLMGKFTISMVIFHSYVGHYQRVAALSSMPKIWNLARPDDHRTSIEAHFRSGETQPLRNIG